MNRKKTTALAASIALVLSLLTAVPVSAADTETELYNFPFADEAAQGEMFAMVDPAVVTSEWVTAAGIGHGDDTAIKITHIDGAIYNSSANALRLTFPEPLAPGGVYRIVASFFVPAEGNENKDTLTGPGFVMNADYAGSQGVVKFPENFGTIPVGEWKQIDVTLPVQDKDITMLDFRFVINDEPKHPDVWYIDNIVVSRIGEMVEVEVPEWDLTLPSLYETFKDYFPVGNIMDTNNILDPDTVAMYKHHYNFLTLENSMKPSILSPAKDQYNYSGADSMIEWAQSNNIQVHGHTLVWHAQSAPWLNTDDSGNPLTRAEAKANLEKYITEVAGHFKGKLYSWDVVNEALIGSPSTNAWKSSLRRGGAGNEASQWYAAYDNGADKDKGESGADYIYDAFVFARLADPTAKLYYNDFNEDEANKYEAMARMAEELNALWKDDPRNTEPDRLLIEGMGLQAHYWTDSLNPANVDAAIARFIAAGCEVGILELDIPAGGYGGLNSRTGDLTESEANRQAALYKGVFDVFKKYSEHITRVTIWGKADPQSWRAKGSPLLFDAMFKAKPAYWSVMSLMGIEQPEGEAGTEPTPTEEATQVPTAEPSPSAAATETPAPTNAPGGGGNTLWIVLGVVAVVAVGVVIAVVLGRKKN